MQFVVDARSEKPEQIEHQPWGEACWYFPDSREQFRFTGLLTLVGAEHSNPALARARQRSWQQLSESARLQYTWPDPGEPRADAAFETSPPNAVEPLPHFCLLLLDPVQVDRLALRGEPQNRTLYCCNDTQEWFVREINP
jgi:PPOX class probable FMN-dependent enzyme